MNTRQLIAACATIASLFSLPATAQTVPSEESGKPAVTAAPGAGPGAGRQGMPGHHGHGMRDCSQSPDSSACQARREAKQKAMAACKDAPAGERRQCMHEQRMNATDCSKARHPERCQAHKQAAQECKGKTGPEFKQCVRTKLPPPDCTKSANPERCAAMQKAREACKGKAGAELRQCLGAPPKAN